MSERKFKVIKNAVIDVKLEASFDRQIQSWRYKDKLQYGKELEQEVKNFELFLRDHRSQDMIDLNVTYIKGDICSACKREIEMYFDEDRKCFYCSNCGAKLEEESNPQTGQCHT